MPRIPTLDDLGARPIPRSNRSVVSVRNAGAVADAVGNLGGKVAGIGQQMLEKQDKLAYAAAKTALLKADVTARTELEQDQDYTTFETRYAERMKAARKQARGLIKSRSDRSMFEAEADLDFERGRSDVLRAANGKRIQAETATFTSSLDTLQDVGRAAMDDATREATIRTAGEMFDAAVTKGLIDPAAAVKGRQAWVSDYLSEQISGAILREDPDKAATMLDMYGDKLSQSARLSFAGDIKRMGDDRQAAADFMGVTSLPTIGKAELGTGKATPVEDGKAAIAALFPKATITSGYRPKDHPLSKANPKSWHTQSHAAVDIKPIPGMSFDQYVKTVEDAGYTVLEALDETGSGKSKHATGDHWHIVLGQGGGVPTNAARRWDKEHVYSGIERRAKDERWSFERTERAKRYADQEIARDEQLLARKEDEADRAASEFILGRMDGFTDVSQIPRSIWSNMSTSARASAMAAAKANVKEKKPEANGDTVTTLELMRVKDPQRFAAIPLGQYAHEMTPAELNQIRVDQAEIQAGKGTATDIASKVSGTIGRYDTPDLWSSDKKTAAVQRVRVQRIMEQEVKQITGGKRPPTDDDLYKAFVSATGTALTLKKTFMGIETGGTVERRRFEIKADDIPDAVATRIRTALKSRNIDPTDERVVEEYQMYKGRYW